MYQFDGCECPICKKTLNAGDDIVVCPDCGAPYHRACYEKAGACVYSAQHKDGFEWTPPEFANVTPIACPACGASCPPDAAFCNHCGQPLHAPASPDQPAGAAPRPAAANRSQNGQPDLTADANNNGIPDFVEQQLDLPNEIDGISLKDWNTYIGPQSAYYLFQFRRQDKSGNKLGFILSAALFAPYYFCYRRMWSVGILAGVLNLMMNIPQAILLAGELGYTLPFTVSSSLLNTVGWVCSVLWIVVNALWGFFAVYLYRRHAGRTIHRWHSEAANEEMFQMHLKAKSGPCRGVLYFIVILIFLAFFSSFASLLF